MRRFQAVIFSLALFLSGCSANRKTIGLRLGPDQPAAIKTEPWTYEGEPAFRLSTEHYSIYTTFVDPAYAKQVAQVLEGGFQQYSQVAAGVVTSTQPMNCYVFARRDQWAEFTRRNTGPVAGVYLQINRGGYTLRDWFVAYDLGDFRTFSVAAHEGWHQFCARNFVGRLPPFLEEGMACMFEDLQMKDDLPRFNLSVNRIRAHALRRAIDHRTLLPLEQLATMHAGEVVGRSGEMIDTFYAQNWAFAKFLWEGEHGKYRPALQKLLADTASGEVVDPTGTQRRSWGPWNPAAVRPLLEHYLGMPIDEIDQHYQRYISTVAYEEYQEQFAS